MNRVGVMLCEGWKKKVVEVQSVSDGMIRTMVATEGGVFNIISAYATQQGSEEADKDRFTDEFEEFEKHTNMRTWP